MKNFSFTILLTLLMSMVGVKTEAHDIAVANGDGVIIYYTWINNYTELSVSYCGTSYDAIPSEYCGSVVIPEFVTYNGKTYSVTSIGNNAFNWCSLMTSVTIPNSVTSIGESAFSDCEDLSSVMIPNSVTNIGDAAFYGCTHLTSIIIPNSVTNIGRSTFRSCYRLTSITIPNSVTSIGDFAFYSSGLTSVTIPNSVTSIGQGAFEGCRDLKSVIFHCKEIESWFSRFSSIKNITIGEEVTTIGNSAFYGCTGLTSITIPNSVTNIGNEAFRGCDGLTSVLFHCKKVGSWFSGNKTIKSIIIGEETNVIGDRAFKGCYGLTNITIGNSVTSIENEAFSGCALTSINIPSSVTSIGDQTFKGCSNLTSITIPHSVTDIGYETFQGCFGLTSVIFHCKEIGSWFSGLLSIKNLTIGEEVTSIRDQAFKGCSGLRSVTFPNSVMSIGNQAFSGCTGLTIIVIPNSVMSIGSQAFSGCTGLSNIVIPNSLTNISSEFFYGCSNLTSVTIPNSVTSISYHAFKGCTGLTSVTIPNSVMEIGSEAFAGCSNLADVTIGNSITNIDNGAFQNCKGLESVTFHCKEIGSWFSGISSIKNITIGEEVIIIGKKAFEQCTGIMGVTIPNSVTTIGSEAFKDCNSLTNMFVPDGVIEIGNSAFDEYSCKLYVNRGASALLSLWNCGYTPYQNGTNNQLNPPYYKLLSSTQTSITAKLENIYGEYDYFEDGNKQLTNYEIKKTDLTPECSSTFCAYVCMKESYDGSPRFKVENIFSTDKISPTIVENATVTSLSIDCSYIHGDAVVNSETIKVAGKVVEGNSISLRGLEPNYNYTAEYIIKVNDKNYSTRKTIRTKALSFKTMNPKVISAGNVIVAADSNLDDEEENVGFEWRRTDWTDDFASNTGAAVLFEGRIEGYILNLNTEKLWKFRPYYESATDKRYYGDWMGIDPTNTSYFEPTIHTYASFTVEGNQVQVKGYAMRGTDNIAQQGFKYWKTDGNSAATIEIPNNAMTLEAKGQVMTASLTGLDYESDYYYVAFMTTSEGETYYGEIQKFHTGETPIGIMVMKTVDKVYEVARYDLRGRKLNEPKPGVNIVQMSDGSIQKVIVRRN